MSAYCYKSMSKCKVIHFGHWSQELPEETHLNTAIIKWLIVLIFKCN